MSKLKRGLAAMLAGLAVTGLAACGSAKVALEDYPTTVVATFGDTNIYLDEANFQARTSQYTNEVYYNSYYGGEMAATMWTADTGTGETLEEYTKENVMRAIHQTYVLKAKAEELGLTLDEDEQALVDATVESTMEGIADVMPDVVNLSEERAREIVTNNALAIKAYEYAIKDVDTSVTDEEAAQRSIRYILVRDGDDAAEAETLAQEVRDRVAGGENTEEAMQAIAEEDSDRYLYVANTFGKGDFENTLGDLGMSLATGETGMAYEDGYGWYVVYCVTDFDEEATEEEKPNIVSERRTEAFQAVYADWEAEAPEFKVNEKIWAVVTFDEPIYETEASTESGEETTASGEETTAGESQEGTAAEETTSAGETTAAEETTAAQ